MIQITSSSDISDLFRHMTSIYRIDQLHNALYPNEQFISQSLTNIWVRVLDQVSKRTFTSFQEAKRELSYLPPEVATSYTKSIETAPDAEKALKEHLSARIELYAKRQFCNIDENFKPTEKKAPTESNEAIIKRITPFLRDMWEEIIQNGSDSLEDAQSSARRMNSALKKIPKEVIAFYGEQTKDVKDIGSFRALAKRFKDNLTSDLTLLLPTEASKEGSNSLGDLWEEISKKPFSSYEEAVDFITSRLAQFPVPELKASSKGSEIDLVKEQELQVNLSKKIESYAKKQFSNIKDLHTIFESKKTRLERITTLPEELESLDSIEEARELVVNQLERAFKGIPGAKISELIESVDLTTNLKDLNTLVDSFIIALPKEFDEIFSVPSQNILKKLGEIWKKASETTFNSREEAIAFIDSNLQRFPLAIQKVYTEDLNSAIDLRAVKAYVNRYYKELISVPFHPILSASVGAAGYPKILTYSKDKSDGSKETFTGFFKHFGSPIEIETHLLYNYCLSNEELSPLFNVPQSLMLDFNERTYTNSSGEKTPITPEMNQRLKTIFTYFATTHTNRSNNLTEELRFQEFIKNSPIGIFERITAPNLSDFLQSDTYKYLSPERKNNLLENLGMISALDILIGNQDRLLNIDNSNGGKYSLFNPSSNESIPLASNLGNLMIKTDSDKFLIHVIDNNLGDGTQSRNWTSDEEYLSNYSDFLKETFSKENPERALAIHLLKSIRTAIEELGTLTEILNDFSDLNHLKPVIQGIRKMRTHIKEDIIPKWNSNDSFNLKSQISPGLTAVVTERFNPTLAPI